MSELSILIEKFIRLSNQVKRHVDETHSITDVSGNVLGALRVRLQNGAVSEAEAKKLLEAYNFDLRSANFEGRIKEKPREISWDDFINGRLT